MSHPKKNLIEAALNIKLDEISLRMNPPREESNFKYDHDHHEKQAANEYDKSLKNDPQKRKDKDHYFANIHSMTQDEIDNHPSSIHAQNIAKRHNPLPTFARGAAAAIMRDHNIAQAQGKSIEPARAQHIIATHFIGHHDAIVDNHAKKYGIPNTVVSSSDVKEHIVTHHGNDFMTTVERHVEKLGGNFNKIVGDI